MTKHVHIKQAIQTAWASTKANLGMLLVISALYLGLVVASKLYLHGHGVLNALSWVAQTLLLGVIILACLHITRRDGAKLGGLAELPLGPLLVLKFLAVSLLTGAVALSGAFLLGLGMGFFHLSNEELLAYAQSSPQAALLTLAVLGLILAPGLVLGLRYSFAPAFVLEEHCGIWASLGHSANLSQGVLGRLFLLLLALVGVFLLGLLCLGVGAVPAFVVTQLAWAWTYVDLHKQVYGEHAAP